MQTLKLLLVNLLTFSRVPLSIACMLSAWGGQWLYAFLLFSVATFTDMADGALAEWLNAKSERGKILDKVCDALTVAAGGLGFKNDLLIAGLFGLENIHDLLFWIVYTNLASLHLLLWIVIGTLPRNYRLRTFCRIISPFYFLTLMVVINITYAGLSLGKNALFLLIGIPILALIAYYKKHRLKSWINGLG